MVDERTDPGDRRSRVRLAVASLPGRARGAGWSILGRPGDRLAEGLDPSTVRNQLMPLRVIYRGALALERA